MMNRSFYFLTVVLLWTYAAASGTEFYVAPNGNDAWSGRRDMPNLEKTDGPFATLERAIAATRLERMKQPLPIRIVVRRGVYLLENPILLGPADSGLIIEGAEGEEVTISGGRVVTGWKPYRAPILQADLSKLDLPDLKFRELYCNGRRQPLARVPNFDPKHPRLGGFLFNADVVESGSKTKFRYRSGELMPEKWTNIERALVVFHPSVNYENVWAPLKSVDTVNHVIEAAYGVYPLKPYDRYYVCGLFEELDAPGEWYVDSEKQVLYFYPPGRDVRSMRVIVPALESAFVLKGDPKSGNYIHDVQIMRLTIREFRGDAVHITGAKNCAIGACELRNIGVGVLLGDETHACRVSGCDITQTAGDGITIRGTPAKHYRVSNHLIDNNYIWDFGWGDIHNRNGGVFMLGCSYCTVTHNHIHDGPRYAIGMDVGNNNVISYNYCHNVNLTTCDTGIIEAATAWDWGKPDEAERNRLYNRNNEIHHNLLHDSGGCQETGPGVIEFPTFSWGIYLDTHCSGWHVYNNVVYNTVRGGFMLNCGQDNIIENNIFVDGKKNQIQFNPWPKYTMSGNRFERNIIAYQGKTATLYILRGFKDEFCQFRNNLIFAVDGHIRIVGVPNLPKRYSWDSWQRLGQDQGSIISDPQFIDPARHDYRLKTISPAIKLGFKPIDLSEVGNRASPERHRWPRPEEKVIREQADYTPPTRVVYQPTLRDYESYSVGEKEQHAHVGEDGNRATVRVTDETAASSRHSLKFTDAPGLKHRYVPYVTYPVEMENGTVHAGFDLRLEERADFVYEWRDDPYHYNLGPNLHVDADGLLTANGKSLLHLPRGKWIRFDLTCKLGARATGTYDLTVQEQGKPPRLFRRITCSPRFDYLDCVVIMSMADAPSVFFLDNLELSPVKDE